MRTSYQYCPIQGKVVPRRDVVRENKSAYVIGDEMPDTKSPADGKSWFNSKSALREHYKQHGVEEVGNSYENGVDPWESASRDRERAASNKIKQNLIDRHYGNRR